MKTNADDLKCQWEIRIKNDYPAMNIATSQSIINWLLGDYPEKLNQLNVEQLAIADGGMNYRYEILKKRYLNVNQKLAYDRLMNRLGSLALLTGKIRTWVALSRDRQQTVVEVLQEIVQEMLKSDRYLQEQLAWISQCTVNPNLRNSLLLASVEEYCLRPIRNQPLIAYRFFNFLQSQARSGITQIPRQELVRVISEETTGEDNSPINLSDSQALENYQKAEQWEQIQTLRILVQQKLSKYLADKIGDQAVQWLNLYLQGLSVETIAQKLNLSIQKVYRLREKISYHALQVFAVKIEPELVQQWLEISLKEHNFGLTPKQWQMYLNNLQEEQRQLILKLKTGQTLEEICDELNWSKTQGVKRWRELYFLAQKLRNF